MGVSTYKRLLSERGVAILIHRVGRGAHNRKTEEKGQEEEENKQVNHEIEVFRTSDRWESEEAEEKEKGEEEDEAEEEEEEEDEEDGVEEPEEGVEEEEKGEAEEEEEEAEEEAGEEEPEEEEEQTHLARSFKEFIRQDAG